MQCKECNKILQPGEALVTGGIKHDENKIPLDLFPWEAVYGVGKVLQHGAIEYGAYNWKKGMAFSRLLAAALGHIFNATLGNDYDQDTGLLHIDHAICDLAFLSTYIKLGIGTDDRWKASSPELEIQLKTALDRKNSKKS